MRPPVLRPWVVPTLAALVAVAVRLPGTFTQALSQDEVASARILREPTFGAMLGRVGRTESTPPLWYTLGWLLHHLGASITDVRLLSVAAGGGLAACVALAARHVVPEAAALVAGLLVAVGSEFVAHGHELRAYESLAFLAAAFVWLLLREAASPNRRNEIAIAVVVSAGGLMHYFFAFTTVAALGWAWFDPAARAIRRAISAAVLCGGTVAAAWAPVMLAQYHRNRFWWIGPFSLRQVLAAPTRLFTLALADTPAGLALSLGSLALLALGAITLGRRGAPERLVVALGVGPLVLAATTWAMGVHIFALRNLIELGAPLAVVVSWLVARVAERGGVVAAGAAAVIALVLPFGAATAAVPRFGGIAHALIAEGWRPSDPLAVFGNLYVYRAPLEWYLGTPRLDAARPEPRTCRAVFVVAGRLPRRLARRAVRVASGPGFVVARLASTPAGHLRGAALLEDPAVVSRCVRPIRTGRLAPIS